MTLPKFPKQALQVLRIIRTEVPRNGKLPGVYSGNVLRWIDPPATWCFRRNCCPMGLHSSSTQSAPMVPVHFAGGRCHAPAVLAFAKWWDSIPTSLAQEAVDFIWGQAVPE